LTEETEKPPQEEKQLRYSGVEAYRKMILPPEEEKQLPVEVFQAFERRDENQILAEMRGELLEELVYDIEIQGRRVTNLSYAGVKEAIRRRGRVEILEVRTEETESEIRALVRVRDHENQIDVLGASTAEKSKPFAYTLAINKSERNAFAKLIPAKWYAVLIDEWLQRHGQKPAQPQPQPIVTPAAQPSAMKAMPDGSREVEVKSSRTNATLAKLSISPDGKEASLIPQIPVPMIDNAYAHFFAPRILEPLREKRGFTINIFQEDGKLQSIHFKGTLDDQHVKEIVNAIRWTLERVLEH